MMTESVLIGDFRVRQFVGLPKIELDATYDFVITTLSWEKRNLSALAATAQAPKKVKVLRFNSVEDDIKVIKENKRLELERLGFDVSVLDLGRSTEFQVNIENISNMLRDEADRLKRPARILFDITCFPKSYLLFVVGVGFRRSFVSRMGCIYAEGNYELDISHALLAADAAAKKGIISEGEWTARQIPYMEADVSIPNRRDLFVCMGGEVALSIPFLERYEPVRLNLVLLSESLVQRPKELPEGERAAIESLLAEPNVCRENLGLADVVGLARSAMKFASSSCQDVVTGVAIGSKPHALALGIVALCDPVMEVVCRVPKKYRPLDVPPAGRFSFYEVKDRFEPTAYLSD